MTAAVLTWGLGLAQLMLICAMGLAAWRIIHGPRAQDRVLGMDTLLIDIDLVTSPFLVAFWGLA